MSSLVRLIFIRGRREKEGREMKTFRSWKGCQDVSLEIEANLAKTETRRGKNAQLLSAGNFFPHQFSPLMPLFATFRGRGKTLFPFSCVWQLREGFAAKKEKGNKKKGDSSACQTPKEQQYLCLWQSI